MYYMYKMCDSNVNAIFNKCIKCLFINIYILRKKSSPVADLYN